MKIFNSLTKKIEDFEPREAGKVKMFVCGPTVYDYIHIGNARTFVFFDVVAKYLKYKGFDVDYIQNITDIDNKIIERAEKESADPLEYAKKYADIFKKDMASLGIDSPKYKNATDHIPQVIQQVQTLMDKNHAYMIDGDGIYFDLSSFPDYGKLSGRTANMADDAVSRIDDSDKKRNRGDFALWKFKQDNDPFWPAPFGDGRPGWHIEDTAITEKYFGPQYDIHGGGMDLMFPHHEAEIAQQESASGKKPFVKYWMHGAFLVNADEKMSKSAGNFTTANELVNKYSKETLRLYLSSSYYRTPLQFSENILKQSEAAANRISQFRINLELTNGSEKISADELKKDFIGSLDNDLNITEGLGHLFSFIRRVNPSLTNRSLSKESATAISLFLEEVNEFLGIISEKYEAPPQEINDLADKREQLRAAKKFEEADTLRDKIHNLGWEIQDSDIYGPVILKK